MMRAEGEGGALENRLLPKEGVVVAQEESSVAASETARTSRAAERVETIKSDNNILLPQCGMPSRSALPEASEPAFGYEPLWTSALIIQSASNRLRHFAAAKSAAYVVSDTPGSKSLARKPPIGLRVSANWP